MRCDSGISVKCDRKAVDKKKEKLWEAKTGHFTETGDSAQVSGHSRSRFLALLILQDPERQCELPPPAFALRFQLGKRGTFSKATALAIQEFEALDQSTDRKSGFPRVATAPVRARAGDGQQRPDRGIADRVKTQARSLERRGQFDEVQADGAAVRAR